MVRKASWRYLGVTPLTEDGVFRSPVTSILNGRADYHFDNGRTVQLDMGLMAQRQDLPDRLCLGIADQD
jgi:hypothetical protein